MKEAALWRAPAPVTLPAGYVAALGLPGRVAELLYRRGWQTPEAALAFLQAGAAAGAPDLPDLAAGVQRVLAAVRAGEPVWVYGDYDADGVAAAAILVRCLGALGAAPGAYVPDRFTEGHGLNGRAVRELAGQGARLLLACGCGSGDGAAVEMAAGLGLDVVVIDGGDPGPGLPERAVAVVHPGRLPADHPGGGLSGAGAAWVFARALLQAAGRSPELADAWLELAAVGILASGAPLAGASRALLQRALPRLPAPGLAGLTALVQASRLQGGVDEGDVAAHLAPRLEAAGRVGHARVALRLLLSDSEYEARGLARQLDDWHARLRELCRRVADEAGALAAAAAGGGTGFVALYRPGWPEGALGPAAAQLGRELGAPVALMARKADGATVTGSARAPAGFPLLDALRRAGAGLFSRCGGGHGAAGFSLPEEHLPAFLAGLRALPLPARRAPHQDADLELPLAEATRELHAALRALAPFGPGNPEPVFLARGVTVLSSRPTAGARQRLVLKQGEATAQALWAPPRGAELPPGPVDVAYRLDLDRWHGAEVLQLVIEAIQRPARPEPAAAAPRRTEWADRRGRPAHALAEEFPGALFFREGPEGRGPGEVDRYSAGPCEVLVFLTPPPSPRVLAEVLALAAPALAVPAWPVAPAPAPPFPRTLLGLVRYAIERRGGLVSLAELAARTGELEAAVLAGLEALAASGFFSFRFRGPGRLALERREAVPAPLVAGPARERLEALLRESAAFRRYLGRAPLAQIAGLLADPPGNGEGGPARGQPEGPPAP